MKAKNFKKSALFTLIIVSSVLLQGCSGFLRGTEDTILSENSATQSTDTAAISDITTTDTVIEIEPSVDPYSDVSVTFTAAGDNLIHPNIYMEAAARAGSGEGYDFTPLFSEVHDIISSANFAFINQETLLAGEEFGISGYPSFNSPQKLGYDLAELGFDIVNIANNHMLDKSAAGLESTMDFWKTLPVTMIGSFYDDTDAESIRTVTADGITIALLSYTYGTNGIVLPSSSELNIPYIDDERITSELKAAEEISDFVIVSIHWGEENTSKPTDEQRRLAHLMAEGGADVILGHHSHTLLPLEWIDNSDGGKTLCAYSLGNLVSAMMYPENMVGGFLNFTIKSNGDGGLCADEVSFIPTVFYYGMNHYSTHIYLLENYTADIATGHGTQMYGYTTTPEKAVMYVKRNIPEEYLPSYLK